MMANVWQIDETEFPTSGSIGDKVNFWLRYAILAPSAHNTQPWRCEFNPETQELLVYRDPAHTLKAGDPTLRETFISLGAFIETFRIAAAHWNYNATVVERAETTDQLLVARLALKEGAAPAVAEGFAGITQRHTNRGFYDETSLPAELVERWTQLGTAEAKIFAITESAARQRIAELVGRGTTIALSMRPMKMELAGLLSHVQDEAPTGMIMESMTEQPPAAEVSGQTWLLEQFDVEAESRYWQETFHASPLHIVIGTPFDGPEAWLEAGQVLQRLLLNAAAAGYTHCIAAAPVEVPPLAPRLRQEIDLNCRPQVLVRIGRPKNPQFTIATGRRPLP